MDVDHQKDVEYKGKIWLDIQDQEGKYVEDWKWQFLNLQNLHHQEKIMHLGSMDNPGEERCLIMVSNLEKSKEWSIYMEF